MLKRIVNGVKRRVRGVFQKETPRSLDLFLGRFSELVEDVFFIQIGANDGQTGDPVFGLVHKKKWRGILVEPVPYLFEKLSQNYRKRKGNLIFEQVAISDRKEKKKFYYINDPKGVLPSWATGLNSFDKGHILWQKKDYPDIEKFVVETELDCITYSELVQRNYVTKIDLLVIDVEGFDFEVIKQIDSIAFLPSVILFEYKCLGEEQAAKCYAFLMARGFKVFKESDDAIAILEKKSSPQISGLIEEARRLFCEVK